MPGSVTIKNIEAADYDFILNLNKENVEVLSPVDREKLEYFRKNAEMFLVARVDGAPAAFLIALCEGIKSYSSENYKWFSSHYPKFIYVDRIVIDKRFRGHGLGRKLYSSVFSHAAETGRPLCYRGNRHRAL